MLDMDQTDGWHGLFEHSPVSLWLEDYSGVKTYLDSLRASGVTDLTAHVAAHPETIDFCMGQLKVLDVNAQTLTLYRAESKEHLLANLGSVFRDEMRAHFHYELMDMWNGKLVHQTEGRNYALDGTPVEIDLRWSILPGYETTWERALVSIIDISERKRAERAQVASEEHARGLFEHSPISMWLEDYSGVKAFLDDIRAQSITDIRAYLEAHPDELVGSMARIKVLDVNHQTLVMFGAKTKEELLSQLDKVFRGDMTRHYTDELVSMWRGNLSFEGEGVNYALNGDPIDIDLRWSVMPGYEDTWERALVSLIDITARKKAEVYLKYLGTHDVLTGLYNRAYFEEERSRMERSRQYPVSIVVADLNGLNPPTTTLGMMPGMGCCAAPVKCLRPPFAPRM
jgi:PAS domain-containing protein